jgi:hypothetical protein
MDYRLILSKKSLFPGAARPRQQWQLQGSRLGRTQSHAHRVQGTHDPPGIVVHTVMLQY